MTFGAVDDHAAIGRTLEASDDRETVDLPHPEWPSIATNSPCLDSGVDVLDGDERAGRRLKDLCQAGELERNIHAIPPRGEAP